MAEITINGVYQRLNCDIWKTGSEVRDLLKRDKEETVSLGIVFAYLCVLEERGRVESRYRESREDDGRIREFKRI